MTGWIKKNPLLAVLGAAVVGGLFLSKYIQAGAGKVKSAI